jgi:hypothetical protein
VRIGTKVLIAMVATAVVAGCVTVGYLLGRNDAPSRSDAALATQEARQSAYAYSVQKWRAAGRAKGIEAGIEAGKDAGEMQGDVRGRTTGKKAANAELAAQAAAAEEAAAAQEAAERSANCGAPLFVEGYCPTDEEIARESAAESLCGGGTAEGQAQAAELGIQC